MGAQQVKDSSITIWMDIDKPYYLPGQTVSGNVYLRVAKKSKYHRIEVKLKGEQYLFFMFKTRYIGNNTYVPTQQSQFYIYPVITVVNFGDKVEKGDYIFPFTFEFKNFMVGSFHYSNNGYIDYKLTATLVHEKGERFHQSFSLPINLIQLPRYSSAISKDEEEAEITGCCFSSYGTVEAKMSINEKIVCPGEPFQVTFEINNINGTIPVKTSKIYFERRVFRGANNGKMEDKNLDKILVNKIQSKVNPGEEKKFQVKVVVPTKFNVPTTIGHHVSNYYILKLQLEYQKFTFYSEPSPKIHIFLHSRNPEFQKVKKHSFPRKWKPNIKDVHNSVVDMRANFSGHVKEMPYKNLYDFDSYHCSQLQSKFAVQNSNIKTPLLNKSDTTTPGDTSREMVEYKDFQNQ